MQNPHMHQDITVIVRGPCFTKQTELSWIDSRDSANLDQVLVCLDSALVVLIVPDLPI